MRRTWIVIIVAGVKSLAGPAALADESANLACLGRMWESEWGIRFVSDVAVRTERIERIEALCLASPSAGAIECMKTSSIGSGGLGSAEYAATFGVASDFCRRNPSERAGTCFQDVQSSRFGPTSAPFGLYHADQLCSLALPRGVAASASINCVRDLMPSGVNLSRAIHLCGRDASVEARTCFRDKKAEGYPQWPLGQICGNPVERTIGIACLSDLVGQGFSKNFSASFCAQTRSPVTRACVVNARELGVPLAVGVQECLRNPSAPNFALIPAAPVGHCLSDSSVPGELVLGTGSTGGQPTAFAATP